MSSMTEYALARRPADWPQPEQLGFGQKLAPWVVSAEHRDGEGWSALHAMPLSEARSPMASGGLQYGLSVFEGLKAYRGPRGDAHLFRPREHAARLTSSARRLRMPHVPESLFIEACRLAARLHEDFLPPQGRGSLYLRPTLFADEEALGFRVAHTHRLALIVTPSSDPLPKTVNLWAESELARAAIGGTGAAKTGGNYAAGLLGLVRARERGCDDVAWLDAARTRLSEAGTMNLFVKIDDTWCTPPLDGTILPGITRDSLMTLMREQGVDVQERGLDLRELATLEREGRLGAAFGCGTAARIVRIASIRSESSTVSFPDDPQVAVLRDRLKRCQEGTESGFSTWACAI
ncbi:branched-chain amino acid aminotransferase [Panacagrimonas perspica]|uniref:Branched-chain amino acid aminotransferase n=1 Tax=Panacagrimonas perspica TaxID=381431 RepID=A0A4R7PCI7_9GAMM|nr:aminotransferase class IV [Panacagrimonas perspica]TDU31452.1 branched-chain amino acid aminotransferase [Panacagrimonas perspica]THD03301.1 branched chain amino acid aminotransferase [Panacagrimonas perspica]